MKRLIKTLLLLVIAAAPMAFSSCDSGNTYYEDGRNWWVNNADDNADSDAPKFGSGYRIQRVR